MRDLIKVMTDSWSWKLTLDQTDASHKVTRHCPQADAVHPAWQDREKRNHYLRQLLPLLWEIPAGAVVLTNEQLLEAFNDRVREILQHPALLPDIADLYEIVKGSPSLRMTIDYAPGVRDALAKVVALPLDRKNHDIFGVFLVKQPGGTALVYASDDEGRPVGRTFRHMLIYGFHESESNYRVFTAEKILRATVLAQERGWNMRSDIAEIVNHVQGLGAPHHRQHRHYARFAALIPESWAGIAEDMQMEKQTPPAAVGTTSWLRTAVSKMLGPS